MLRLILPLAVALSATLPEIRPALAADNAVTPKRATARAAAQLPPGLPHRPYVYKTTIAPPTYVRRGRQLVVVEEPEVFPQNALPYIPVVRGEPLLPGSTALPGYYGTPHSYSYTGPYYGGAYVHYWDRLPYACGVYGYC